MYNVLLEQVAKLNRLCFSRQTYTGKLIYPDHENTYITIKETRN